MLTRFRLVGKPRKQKVAGVVLSHEEVKLATRSRKGLPFPWVTPALRALASPVWRMSGNRIGQQPLTNQWLHEQGVPDMRTLWIVLHYGPQARV